MYNKLAIIVTNYNTTEIGTWYSMSACYILIIEVSVSSYRRKAAAIYAPPHHIVAAAACAPTTFIHHYYSSY